MALVGSLSGSTGTVSITGSLLPSTNNTYSLGNSSLKWTSVSAYALTGSLTKLEDGTDYLRAGSNVTLTTGSDGSVTIASTGGGGGTPGGLNTQVQFNDNGSFAGAASFTFATGTNTLSAASVDVSNAITSSVLVSSTVVKIGAPASPFIGAGSDVFFFVSGSTSKRSVFQSDIVTSGSLTLRSGLGAIQVLLNNGTGGVSGSGNFDSGGNLTIAGNATLGDSTADSTTVNGSLTVGGTTITATAPTTINFGNTAATVNIGQAGTSNTLNVRGNLDVDGTADIAGTVTLSGNSQSVTHSGTGNLTISSTGGSVVVEGTTFNGNDVTVVGDVAVNGGDLTTTSATATVFNTGATTSVTIAGAAATTTIGSSTGKVVVPGDLEVQGTTITADVTNITVEDPLIGLGFTSGSVAAAAGDRGFIGGISGADNVAFAWSNANSAFIATKTATAPGSTTIAVSSLQPVRASSVEFGGATTKITSSDGAALIATASAALTLQSGDVMSFDAGSSGFAFKNNNLQFLSFTKSGNNLNVLTSNVTGIGVFNSVAWTAASLFNSGSTISVGSAAGLTAQTINLGTTATGNTAYNLGSGATTTGNTKTVELGTNGTAGSTTNVNIGSSAGGTTAVKGTFSAEGNVTLGDSTADRLTITAYVTSSIIPSDDSAFTLGLPDKRWQHVYTGDLHLRNDRGDYTLIEETDFLSIRFNKNGKRYKFLLERVPELDEPR